MGRGRGGEGGRQTVRWRRQAGREAGRLRDREGGREGGGGGRQHLAASQLCRGRVHHRSRRGGVSGVCRGTHKPASQPAHRPAAYTHMTTEGAGDDTE